MPNYCENELVIRLRTGAMAVWDAIKNDEATGPDFNKLVPYPEHFAKADDARRAWERRFYALPKDEQKRRWAEGERPPEDGYNKGGYEWCRDNWGTKWNAGDCKAVQLPEDEDDWTLVLQFDTAWNPATTIAEVIAKRWPDAQVSLQFWERGMEFQGLVQWEKGERTLEQEAPYWGHRGG